MYCIDFQIRRIAKSNLTYQLDIIKYLSFNSYVKRISTPGACEHALGQDCVLLNTQLSIFLSVGVSLTSASKMLFRAPMVLIHS